MDKKTRNELLQPQTGKGKMQEILNKFSFVTGIFVDKDYFGLIFLNREKRSAMNSILWLMFKFMIILERCCMKVSWKTFILKRKFLHLFIKKGQAACICLV